MEKIAGGEVAGRMKLGDFDVYALCAGRMRFDGGSVFGVAPKVHWEKLLPPDELNRVEAAMWCLLVKTPDALVLIETGFGGKVTERLREVFDLREGSGLVGAVRTAGFEPEDVDIVTASHLHQDHAGGATVGEPGAWRPTFPNARFVAQKGEWDDAWEADGQTVNGYRRREVMEPLLAAGVVHRVEGDAVITPGIQVAISKGHTRCHQSVMIRSGGETMCFPGDLVPTRHHLRPIYVLAWDLYGRDTFVNKQRTLGEAADENWWMVFPHGDDCVWGKVRRDERKEFALVEESALRV